MQNNVEEKAKTFATAAHKSINQKRKYNNEPYIKHCEEVVSILKAVGITDEEVLAAAWLHDVVEDTNVKLEDLQGEFPPLTVLLVEQLTDAFNDTSIGNRAFRKSLENKRLTVLVYPDTANIKLADIISNTINIVNHIDESFGFLEIYLNEVKQLIENYKEKHIGLPVLRNKANEEIEKANTILLEYKIKKANDSFKLNSTFNDNEINNIVFLNYVKYINTFKYKDILKMLNIHHCSIIESFRNVFEEDAYIHLCAYFENTEVKLIKESMKTSRKLTDSEDRTNIDNLILIALKNV